VAILGELRLLGGEARALLRLAHSLEPLEERHFPETSPALC
jgi:hypothetical protein